MKRSEETHRQLARISRECHRAVAKLAPKITRGDIGRQRQEVRRILRMERARIDKLVVKLLGSAPTPARRARKGKRAEAALFNE